MAQNYVQLNLKVSSWGNKWKGFEMKVYGEF